MPTSLELHVTLLDVLHQADLRLVRLVAPLPPALEVRRTGDLLALVAVVAVVALGDVRLPPAAAAVVVVVRVHDAAGAQQGIVVEEGVVLREDYLVVFVGVEELVGGGVGVACRGFEVRHEVVVDAFGAYQVAELVPVRGVLEVKEWALLYFFIIKENLDFWRGWKGVSLEDFLPG